MSIPLSTKLWWVAVNFGRGLLVALAVTPLLTALSLSIRWPLDGWTGSPIEIFLGWTLLTLPFVVILGTPTLVVVLVAIWLLPPTRQVALAVCVVVGGGLFTILLTRPFDRDPSAMSVALAAAVYLPLWLVYGAIVRLPLKRPQLAAVHG